jgi:hypothetical protein
MIQRISYLVSRMKTHFFGFSCSPILCPWFKFPQRDTPIDQFHRLIFACQWKHRRKIMFIQVVLWPLKSLLGACKNAIKYGRMVKKQYHLSIAQQWVEMVYLANFYNLPPELYYKFRLFEKKNREKILLFIPNTEMLVLMEVLRPTMYKDFNLDIINDKTRFLNQCKIYGLPVPQTVVLFHGNKEEQWIEGQPGVLPTCDLFLKFTTAFAGEGAERWIYDEATQDWRNDAQVFDQAQLISYCRKKSLKKPVLVQRCLMNSKEIVQFGGALSTVRVITCLLPDGKAEVLSAGLRMSIGKTVVDNYSVGGIIAPIDLTTGILSSGKCIFSAELFDRHPDTQAMIAGYRLTCWKEIMDLSIKAQKCFGNPLSVGWDIAITEEGLKIIEGNTHYCFEVGQICAKPFGETVLPSLYLEALSNL